MKQYIFLFFFALLSFPVKAQYNYQSGILPINGTNFKVYVSGGTISIKNTANVLNDMDMFQGIGNEMCGDASFDKAGCEALDNVFRQVFPPARRSQFINRHRIFATIYADAVGKVKEIVFDFDVTSTVTPQELYQLDVSLKALPALNYIFKDCTGANYRVSGYTFYINQLD